MNGLVLILLVVGIGGFVTLLYHDVERCIRRTMEEDQDAAEQEDRLTPRSP